MNSLPKIKLQPNKHRNENVVQVIFEKNEAILAILRTNTLLKWSKTMGSWYLPDSTNLVQVLYQLVKNKAWLNYDGLRNHNLSENKIIEKQVTTTAIKKAVELPTLSEDVLKKIKEFNYWLRSKRYSESTIGTYIESLTIFLRYFEKKHISEITNDDLILFNNQYILAKNYSASYQNQVVNAVKLFFSCIENKKINPELIHRPKRMKMLPNVLSKEEIKLILQALTNIKHKAMLSLIYSCGLRRGELLNLKLNNIDSKRGLIIIKQAKGKKDRIVPLSNKILVLLRDYYSAYKPKEWLFEGQDKTSSYDERSLANVLKSAVEKCGIKKPVTLHWLRHSYATHLLENGTDLRYIQEILGHSRSTTTEIYTHVSDNSIRKVISPFDNL